jgi:replicative DNA helicase
MPYLDADLEAYLVGRALIDPSTIYVAALDPGDFAQPTHQKIWRRCKEILADNRQPGIAELSDIVELRVLANLAELGGTHRPGDIPSLASRIRELSRGRQIASKLMSAFQRGEVGGQLESSLREALTVNEDSIKDDAARPLQEILTESFDILESEKMEDERLPTGFPVLDTVLGGLFLGQVYSLGARPSMGKSSLVRQLMLNVAAQGYGVHDFSMEDTNYSLACRILSGESGIPLNDLIKGNVTQEEIDRLRSLRFPESLLIDDTAGLTIADIVSRIYRHHSRIGTKLVVVDYLQYIRGDRDERIRANGVLAELNKVARDLRICVILVCQLSRKLEDRDDKRPIMSDFKDTGAIEEKSYCLLSLYRPEKYGLPSPPGAAELIVLKNKNGPVGTIDLMFEEQTASFREVKQGD